MIYLVIAGGFYSASEKITGTKLESVEPENAMVDYLIGIENLPAEFTAPTSHTVKRKFYCEDCKCDIPEWEIEHKTGCWQHKHRCDAVKVPKYDDGKFEKYELNQDWDKGNVYRIWVSNINSMQKMKQIWNYCREKYPANKTIPLPIPLGSKTAFLVTRKDMIPVIKLDEIKPEVVERKIEPVVIDPVVVPEEEEEVLQEVVEKVEPKVEEVKKVVKKRKTKRRRKSRRKKVEPKVGDTT